jgi:hypothetical protein
MTIAQWKNFVYRCRRAIAWWMNFATSVTNLETHAVPPALSCPKRATECRQCRQGQAATLPMARFSQPRIDSQDRINEDDLRRMEADRVEKRRQRESATERQREAEATANAARTVPTSSPTTAGSTQVMDMHFCISNLDAIRAEAGDFTLKDFSDYWAPDNRQTAPSAPRTL